MFSSDSRWDRHTPEQSRQEVVMDVQAIFKEGRLKPTHMRWPHHDVKITEVTYHWQEKRGRDLCHFYTVTDGANLYKIYFNTQYLVWRLCASQPMDE